MHKTEHELYRAAVAADAAWSAAIKAAFPRERAGDVRYTAKAHGEPGSPLRAAYDARTAACKALGNARILYPKPAA